MTDFIDVSEPYFGMMRNGTKIIEGKKNTPKWQTFKVGTLARIRKAGTDESFLVEIVAVRNYADHRSYLENEGLVNTLPGVDTINAGCEVYEKLMTPQGGHIHQTRAEILQYGFRAMQLKIVKESWFRKDIGFAAAFVGILTLGISRLPNVPAMDLNEYFKLFS